MSKVIAALQWPHRALSEWLRDRIPALGRFDAWANAKEREWNRRRKVPLVAALRDAGLHEQADRLSE